MDIKSQARKLSDFINQYTSLWSDEIMHEYPESIMHYKSEWIQLLDSLSPDDLYAVDCKLSVEKIKGSSFEAFMQKARELAKLPMITERPEVALEDWAFNGVNKKKRHEIQKIIPQIKKIKEKNPFDYVVDIGGGVGHLSRVLAHYHSIPTVSLDANLEFQNIGRERLLKYRKLEQASEVKFIHLKFQRNLEDQVLADLFKPESFSLGLHTCGSLSNTLIEQSMHYQTSGFLSFGCCYHRMNPETDFPLSSFYKTNQFQKLNLYALSLATRSHAGMERGSYETKKRVKYYRYALHLFLMRHFKNKYFTDVGECHIRTYWEPFAGYIRSKLKELNLEHNFSDEEFENFYHDESIQKELKLMFICNIIRWTLGRTLEVYLLLDRAIFILEQGYKPQIEVYFEEALSPRNIGILALKI